MKQEKNTKKIIGKVAVFAIVIVLVVGGIMAYLTDTDSKTNNFTIGNVDIVLHEDGWDALADGDGTVGTPDTTNSPSTSNGIPDVAENVVANQVITKDPTIENVGNNPAFVYLKVTVPTATVNEANDTTTTNKQLFTYTTNAGWTELTAARSHSGTNNIYYYYYNTALAAGATTTNALFDSVIVTDMKNTTGITTSQTITVDAYAIQSTSLPSGANTVTTTEWATSFTTGANGILTPTNS